MEKYDNFEDLECCILEWAHARGILQNSTPQAQLLKAVSEMGELADAINKDNTDDIKDGIGDVIVCLVNLCNILEFDIVNDCLASAYNQIKDRKGFLNENGVFVKE
jgi:uncharacterized protein YabN with tetrapyrrole methylase and pyrophosphatase domain